MSFIEIIKKKYNNILYYNHSMAPLTTWKIGGIAKCIAFPKSKMELISLMNFIYNNKIPYYILGKGSNILIGDNYYEGIVIYLSKNYNFYQINNKLVYAESGLLLNNLGRICENNNLKGIEFLRGIPGSLGGALITNAEAHNVTISQFVKRVLIWKDGKLNYFTRKKCKFSYRSSLFEELKNFLILAVELKFEKGEKKLIKKNYQQVLAFRKKNQPKYPSAGSIFKNPKNNKTAGYLIDSLGLKKIKKNKIIISPLHSNFILNLGDGKAKDVLKLINIIKKEVKKRYGIELNLEIKKFNC